MDCECFAEFKGVGLEYRVLYASDNLLVLPALGSFVEGYLLIVTKQHYRNFAALPHGLYPELGSVQAKVRCVLTREYGNPLFFEHGSSSINSYLRAGCCVDHAHIHAVPVDVDIVGFLRRKGFDPIAVSELENISSLCTDQAYFFVEDKNGKYIVLVNEVVPSQYIRQIIAAQFGIKDWNWRTNPRTDVVEATLTMLKGKF